MVVKLPTFTVHDSRFVSGAERDDRVVCAARKSREINS